MPWVPTKTCVHAALASMLLFLASPAPADAREPLVATPAPLLVKRPTEWPSEQQATKPGQPLLRLRVQPTSVAVIASPVKISVALGMGSQAFQAGSLFYVVDTERHVYCAPGQGGSFMGIYFGCLHDNDGDGTFEAQGWGGRPKWAYEQYFGFTEAGKITDMGLYSAGKPLASPIGYALVQANEGPVAPVELRWRVKSPKPGASASPVLSLWLNAGKTNDGLWIQGPGADFPLDEYGRGQITFFGITLTVEGMKSDGSLVYRITNVDTPDLLELKRPGSVTTIYIY